VINLERGEKLLESISVKLMELDVKNAVMLSCIGSLQKAVWHVVSCCDLHPVDKIITMEKSIELSSMQGVVLDGQPHFHMIMSDLEQTYTGHLEEDCIVLYLAEITLMEIKDLDIYRKKNEYGIGMMMVKE